jgi:hypothetical protein
MVLNDYPCVVASGKLGHDKWWYGWKKASYALANNQSASPVSRHSDANQQGSRDGWYICDVV